MNSFGFGGSNSHAVLDDACNYLRRHNLAGRHRSVEHPAPLSSITLDPSYLRQNGSIGAVNGHTYPPVQSVSHNLSSGNFDPQTKSNLSPNGNSQITSSPKVLVLSSADKGGIYRLGTVYGKHFTNLSLHPQKVEAYMEKLAYTLNVRRSSLPWRSFIIASSPEQMDSMQTKISKPVCAVVNPELGFIFNGQGAQWYAMGRELLSFPVFMDSIREAELHFIGFGCPWSLIGMIIFVAVVQV